MLPRIALLAAVTLLAVPAAAARLEVASAEPVLVDGTVDARGEGTLRIVREAAAGEEGGVASGLTGALDVWTYRVVDASGVRVPQEPATSRTIRLDGATMAIRPNGAGRLDVVAVASPGGVLGVAGPSRGEGVPVRLEAPLAEDVGDGDLDGDALRFRAPRGWAYVGAYEAYAPARAFPAWSSPVAGFAGPVAFQVRGADLRVEDGAGTTDLWTGRRPDPSPLAAAGAVVEQWVVFRGEAASARIPAAPTWAFAAPRMTWTVEGSAAWRHASGSVSEGGTTRRFEDAAVAVEGAFVVAPAPAVASTSYAASGDFAARVDGAALAPASSPATATTVGVAALLGGALAVAWRFLPALYTRTAPDRLLDHPGRRAIYAAAALRPGIHLRGLHRAVGGAWGPFTFHLRLLRQGGYLRFERQGRYTLVHPTTSASVDPVVPHPVTRAVYDAVPADGSVVAPSALRDALGLSRQLLAYHLRILETRGLVRAVRAPTKGVRRETPGAAPRT